MKLIHKLNRLSPKCFWLLCFISLFNTPSVSAQILEHLPDSVKKTMARLPEAEHDSVYFKLGMSLITTEGITERRLQAIDCFKMAYSLAEKYGHKKNMVGFTHALGEVYDADKNYPDQILYYYKKSYELGEIISKEYQMYAAFDVAYAYGLLQDSVNSLKYLQIVDNYRQKFFKPGDEQWDNVSLMLANQALRNNQIPSFLKLFEPVNKNKDYKNGRFPFQLYFVFCSLEYYNLKKDYKSAIELMQSELKKKDSDTTVLLSFLANTYAKAGNYKEAYETCIAHNDHKSKTFKASLEKDFAVKSLKTAKEVEEKEKLFQQQQNQYLIWGLLFALLAAATTAYFWYANHNSKVALSARNEEKALMLHEIHHRVKNNLQLLHSLAKLQLPNITDEKSRELWQKNLSQLNTMSLVNEKLYNTEGVTSFELKDFIPEIIGHYRKLQGSTDKTDIKVEIQGDLNVKADFAVPFGLILSELITNSYKYACNGEQPYINLSVLRKDEKQVLFTYSDSGKINNSDLILNKKTGGSALIRDLTRQLKGALTISNDNYLQYKFSLPL